MAVVVREMHQLSGAAGRRPYGRHRPACGVLPCHGHADSGAKVLSLRLPATY